MRDNHNSANMWQRGEKGSERKIEVNSQESTWKGLEDAANATEQGVWELSGRMEGQSRGDRRIQKGAKHCTSAAKEDALQ